jgi:hypothetical protein
MKHCVALLFTLVFSLSGFSQKLKINEANIYISEKTHPIIEFGKSIRDAKYDEDMYDIAIDDDPPRITIKEKSGKKPQETTLWILDDKKNQYLFKLIFVPNKKFTPYISLTSDEEIEEFLAKQEDATDKKKSTEADKSVAQKQETPSPEANQQVDKGAGSDAAADGTTGGDKVLDIKTDELHDYVHKLVNYFYQNCTSIHNDKGNAQTYIKRVMERVFNNCDSCVVQTLSKREKNPIPLKIPVYLNRLKILPYKKVNIQAENITIASNIRKSDNGKYYATITILQKFEGYTGSELRQAYKDVTVKTSEIEIVVFDVVEGGNTKQKWRAYLRDIKATEIQE